MNTNKTADKNIGDNKQGTTKPHPAPDPTKPQPARPDTRIPVKPDEDNDFTEPKPPVKEPQSNDQGIEDPDHQQQRKDAPGYKNQQGFDDPTSKGDPGRIDPSGPQNPALSPRNTSWLMIIMLILSISWMPLNTSAEGTVSTPPSTEVSAEAKILIDRLEEIKSMDKSTLSHSEKRTLRKEVRSIKEQLKELSGGVYLSIGAIIIIILLLILLL